MTTVEQGAERIPVEHEPNHRKMLAKEVREQLVGAWNLISWYEARPNGQKVYPLGPDARGQIIYSADGRVAAQLVRADLNPFANSDWREASMAERAAAWLGYFGYFGTFSIDEERQAVIHHIEGSWSRTWPARTRFGTSGSKTGTWFLTPIPIGDG